MSNIYTRSVFLFIHTRKLLDHSRFILNLLSFCDYLLLGFLGGGGGGGGWGVVGVLWVVLRLQVSDHGGVSTSYSCLFLCLIE